MKYLGRITLHSALILAFMVGALAYWSALGILALFIWLIAIIYTIFYRLTKACIAFFAVLFTTPHKTNRAARSGGW